MKNTSLFVTFVIMSLFFLSLVSAVPKIEPYVNDYAHLMNSDQINKLNLLADSIENKTTYEIAIVTVDTTNGQDPIEYANQIGDENGVGKKGKDNGIVILISMDPRKAVIATGRYSESIINDAKAGRIIDGATQNFKDGNFYDGLNYMVNELNKAITLSQTNTTNGTSSAAINNDDVPFFLIILFITIIICGIISWVSDNPNYDDDDSPSSILPAVAITSAIGSSSSHSGSSGFSGGSFGGGSFGGGGAGRGF